MRTRTPLVGALKVAALVVGAVAVAMVAGELTVRRVCGNKFGARPPFYAGDPLLGWKPTRDLNHTFYGYDFDIDIRTDAEGYRLGALGEVDYGKKLVVLAGDSFSFGWGVSTHETFASQLDVILDQRSGGTMRVVNLGVGAYGMVQTGDRLARFFDAHPDVRATVLVQHTVNDAIDNFENIGYHLGVWNTTPVSKPRSRFHLVNFAKYARELWIYNVVRRSPRPGKANVPFVQDLLWSYDRDLGAVEFPREIALGGRQIAIKGSYGSEVDREALAKREQLSPNQSELMYGALNCIHALCVSHHAPVIHMFIAPTPEWYAAEVGALARKSAEEMQCLAWIPGRVPEPGEYGGSIVNPHSGGHFTPQFNRFWAERVAAYLEARLAPGARD